MPDKIHSQQRRGARLRAVVRWLAFAVLCLGLAGHAMAQPKPLRIGVLPTLGAGLLLSNYQPLREYLARELARPVEMFTSKDIPSFHRDTLDGRYDMVVTAAHLARLAQREAGWLPVATYLAENRPVLLTSKLKPLTSVRGLVGRQIAVNNRAALVVIVTMQWLSEQGLTAGRDYELVDVSTFSGAVQALQREEAALAIVADLALRQIPRPITDEVQVFRTLPAVPSLIWSLSPPLRAESALIQATLLKFTSALPDGEKFFKATGFGGMRGAPDDMMRALDPYADRARGLLQARP